MPSHGYSSFIHWMFFRKIGRQGEFCTWKYSEPLRCTFPKFGHQGIPFGPVPRQFKTIQVPEGLKYGCLIRFILSDLGFFCNWWFRNFSLHDFKCRTRDLVPNLRYWNWSYSLPQMKQAKVLGLASNFY